MLSPSILVVMNKVLLGQLLTLKLVAEFIAACRWSELVYKERLALL
jgi:hypothetical protein